MVRFVNNFTKFDSQRNIFASELHTAIILAKQLSIGMPKAEIAKLISNNFGSDAGFYQTSIPTELKHLNQPQITSTYHILSAARLLNIDLREIMGIQWIEDTIDWIKQYAWKNSFVPIEYPTLPERIPWLFPIHIHYVVSSLDMLGLTLNREQKSHIERTLIAWIKKKSWSTTGLSSSFRLLDFIGSLDVIEQNTTEQIQEFVIDRFSENGFSEINQSEAKSAHKADEEVEIANIVSTTSACYILTQLNYQDWNLIDIPKITDSTIEKMTDTNTGAVIKIQEFKLKEEVWPLEIAAALVLTSFSKSIS
jgi:hypothetical protein